MRLSNPIVSNGRVMLQGDRTLSTSDISALQRRYPNMRVRVGDPVLDSLIEFEDDSRERETAASVQQQVSQCLTKVHERFAERASLSAVQVGALQSTVRELMEYIKSNPASAALVSTCMDHDTYISEHSGNVFYLSMLLGFRVLDYVMYERRRQTAVKRLRSDFARDLVPLGLGAMVMDLGMQPLQPLLNTDRPLSDAERSALREHPEAGVRMLPESISAITRMVVRTHHEDYCGTGYPKALPPEKVHIFTRIVRIADAYDAATSERVYRNAKSPARVLWEMTIGPYREFYDPKLMRGFAGLIQPFPIGSKLRLNDGRYAAVVQYNRKNPFDPLLIIAFDADNRLLPKQQLEGPLKLTARRDLRIASLYGEDLSYLYQRSAYTPRGREEITTPLAASYP